MKRRAAHFRRLVAAACASSLLFFFSTQDLYPRRGVHLKTAVAPAVCAEKQYHVLLTAASGVYQEWQTKIAYYHYLKHKRSNPCSVLGNFTRLHATPDARPDRLSRTIPTVTVPQLKNGGDCDDCDHGFVVLNRPRALISLFNMPNFDDIVTEDFILIVETDHLILKPPPLVATLTSPVAFQFYYMTYKYDRKKLKPVVQKYVDDPDAVDPVGPSPLLVHKQQMRRMLQPWWELCLQLKRDRRANLAFGWVLEMWAWTLSAARMGIKHIVEPKFQAEPVGMGMGRDIDQYYLYHYTFDLDVWGWKWSKRNYFHAYPPLLRPPHNRHLTQSTRLFVDMMNEAMNATFQ